MKLDRHIYQYDTMVIGGGLSATLYSYYNNLPCIYISGAPPFRFDMLEEGSLLGSEETNMLEIWRKLNFILGVSGKSPMGGKVSSMNISDNLLKAPTHNSRMGRFEFKKLIIFDDQGVFGLPSIRNQKIGKSRVLDWFDVRSGMEHDHDSLETEGNFIQKVIFYPSDRFGNQKSGRVRKDLVSISYLDEGDVKDFEYSDTMARFKILQMMKDAGIKGTRNGRDTYNPEIYRYYSPKIEATQREVIPDVTNYYEEDERFEFRYDTADELIKQFDEEPDSYASKLLNLLTKAN